MFNSFSNRQHSESVTKLFAESVQCNVLVRRKRYRFKGGALVRSNRYESFCCVAPECVSYILIAVMTYSVRNYYCRVQPWLQLHIFCRIVISGD